MHEVLEIRNNMGDFFSRITLIDTHKELIRNIISLRESEDLFDDLTNDPEEWLLAQKAESDAKPYPYQSHSPEIHRPFEEVIWFNAIIWPFKHWQKSRFSDVSFGVWYGSDTIETTVYETAYHWYRGLLTDAGFEKEPVVIERKLYSVNCAAALLDVRPLLEDYPLLIHKTDYSFCLSVGSKIHREGHPGLVTISARHEYGNLYAVLNPYVLSNPRYHSYLTYILDNGRIMVEKAPGKVWFEIAVSEI